MDRKQWKMIGMFAPLVGVGAFVMMTQGCVNDSMVEVVGWFSAFIGCIWLSWTAWDKEKAGRGK